MMPATEDLVPTDRPAWTPLVVAPIASHDEYVACAEHLKTVKAYQKRVIEFFRPHKRRLDEAKSALLEDERKALQPANETETACKAALCTWDEAQEQIRLAEERRLRELARQQEEERRLAEAAAMELEANRTEDPALLYEANELIEQPVMTPAVIVAKSTPKVQGISYREVWKFRVTNAALVPREYTKVDDVKIGGVVRALKGTTKIAGVEIYCEKVAAAGGR
jgi:hypothetical protein